MSHCVVNNCKNKQGDKRNNKKLLFHKFPTSGFWKNKWLIAIGRQRNEFNTKLAYVCEDHFRPDSYKNIMDSQHKNIGHIRILKTNAVPDLNISVSNKIGTTLKESINVQDDVNNNIRYFLNTNHQLDFFCNLLKLQYLFNKLLILYYEKFDSLKTLELMKKRNNCYVFLKKQTYS